MLRLAFDLDGTLADLDSALAALTERLFPGHAGQPSEDGTGRDPADANGLTPEEEQLEPPQVRALSRAQQHRVWSSVHATGNFWETLDETEPGIVSRLAALAARNRWEVIFLTQRPQADGDTTQRQSQQWLARKGFDLPSVFVLPAGVSRGQVAAALALDVLVDDRTENCLDVKSDSKARAILVRREGYEQVAPNARRLGIETVRSVGECLDQLEGESSPARGLLRRLRQKLGV